MPDTADASTARARALVVLLGVCWGLNWIAVRIALHEVRPWSLRCIGMGLGTVTLLAWAAMRGHPLTIAPGAPRLRLALAGVLNVAAFGVFTAFAQLAGSTARVTMVTYTMPIWSVLFARVALGERLDAWKLTSLALAAAGLAVLIGPLAAAGSTAGMGWALAAALAWAAIAYHVLLGMALPYLLWFSIVKRLPASSAALGTLLVPVVAVLGSVALLGERPTPTDAVGFALIFAAASAVLLRGAPAPVARPSGDPA